LLRPRNFQIAVAYRLGVPVLDHEIPCPLCKQPINIFGDHATCCAKKGDVIIRHKLADALLSPVMEKKGILGNTTGRRPGDVTFQRWAEGKALVIDVAVTSPLMFAWRIPATGTRQPRSMASMTQASKTLSILQRYGI